MTMQNNRIILLQMRDFYSRNEQVDEAITTHNTLMTINIHKIS